MITRKELAISLVALVAAVFALGTAASNAPKFTIHAALREGTFSVPASAEKAFPLFEPVPEKQWAEGWDPTLVHPASGDAVEGMVFTSRDHGGHTTVWTIAHLDRLRHEITYINFTPEFEVARLDLHCTDGSDGATVTVRHAFTALSEAGNHFADQFTAERFAEHMHLWQNAITSLLNRTRGAEQHADL